MQYELQIFHDEQHEEFRTLEIDGEPWFVGLDVCRKLQIKNPSDAYARLDPEDLGTAEVLDRRGAKQKFRIVNESGLFALIFESRRPEAKRFKRWVTAEVLPSIRRTGSYGATGGAVAGNWKPFHDRISMVWGAVPDGYFSIFKEMAELTGLLITNGVSADHRTIPDISAGQAWGKYWTERALDADYGQRVPYEHRYPPSFPQARSNPQWAHCYPDEALAEFRRWFRFVYCKDALPRYISGKASKGEITKATAAGVLKAIGAPPKAPRIS